MNTVYLRFNSYKWIREFRAGNIRLNCPLIYQNVENPAIGDKHEGIADEITTDCSPDSPPDIAKSIVAAFRSNILSKEITIRERYYYTNAHKDRILCLYKLELDNEKIITPVSEKNKMFSYDSFAIIPDINLFFDRMKNRFIDNCNYVFSMGEVNYNNITRGRNAFDKPLEQCYQNEYRILLTDTNIPDYNDGVYPPLDIALGDIADISSDVYDIDSLFSAKTTHDFVLKKT